MKPAEKLWREIRMVDKRTAEVTLTRCRNCGEVKVASRPCGFDHLAAIMEFNADRLAS